MLIYEFATSRGRNANPLACCTICSSLSRRLTIQRTPTVTTLATNPDDNSAFLFESPDTSRLISISHPFGHVQFSPTIPRLSLLHLKRRYSFCACRFNFTDFLPVVIRSRRDTSTRRCRGDDSGYGTSFSIS